MKTFDDFISNFSGSILLLGDPGVGKTTLTTQLPNPYLIEMDANLRGPIKAITQNNLKRDFRYDIPHIDADGKEVPRSMRWSKFAACAKAAVEDPWVRTIVIDSLTTFQFYLEDEVRKQQGRAIADGIKTFKDEPLALQDWRPFAGIAKEVIMRLKSTGKLIVFIGHIDARVDENTESKEGPLLKYINFPGMLRQNMGALFDDVWLMETERRTIAGKVQTIRTLQTGSADFRDKSLGLKDSRGFDHKFILDFATFLPSFQ